MPDAGPTTVRHVTVIGGGLMGAGIAETSVAHGFHTTVVELDAVAVERSRANVERHLHQLARKHRKDAMAAERFLHEAIGRLSYTTSLAEGVRQSDLVIEAIVENLEAKHELFVQLDKFAPAHCVLVSNTSSLSINRIASILPPARRSLFVGLHFFSPVIATQIVEIIRCDETTPAVHQLLEHFVSAIGKQSLTCLDTPGFVVNGLLIPLITGGVQMVERGVASAADVDRAMRLALFHPMGPLQLADFVGLDVASSITESMALAQPENPLYKSTFLRDMVARGELGRKSGKGFYDYDSAAGKGDGQQSGGVKSKL